MSSGWVDPDYRNTLLPSQSGSPYLWAPACSCCGALVLDQVLHAQWHYELWLALGGAPREP